MVDLDFVKEQSNMIKDRYNLKKQKKKVQIITSDTCDNSLDCQIRQCDNIFLFY